LADATPARASGNAPQATPPKRPELAAERRPITVMFCDLVGSTSLAARLDAEDWRNLLNAYLDEASMVVTGLGGHVPKRLGDGVMALFGYPQAQENDAERAVRAALAIQRALADLNARNVRSGVPELSARIGLDCGSVVVDAAGEVFGEAPNVAARVQAAAEPGTVLVTASVLRQTAGLLVVEDKGAHGLKGVPRPVALYRILRASGGGRRGGSHALTPLVGREDELALLMRRWTRALDGEGQFVQIVGEPGLGKSRLIAPARTFQALAKAMCRTTSSLRIGSGQRPAVRRSRLSCGCPSRRQRQHMRGARNLRLRPLHPPFANHAPLQRGYARRSGEEGYQRARRPLDLHEYIGKSSRGVKGPLLCGERQPRAHRRNQYGDARRLPRLSRGG